MLRCVVLYTYRAECSRVVDGDTIDLAWLDLGWGVRLYPTPDEPLRLRFAGVNAYETTLRNGTTPEQKALGIEARAWLADEIEGKRIRVRSVLGGKRGSFGRFLVWVWPDGDPDDTPDTATSLNVAIIERGWGVPYAG